MFDLHGSELSFRRVDSNGSSETILLKSPMNQTQLWHFALWTLSTYLRHQAQNQGASWTVAPTGFL